LNYKIRNRYKNFNNGEQNSYPVTSDAGVIYQYSPNTEDINDNGILDTLNNYFEYKIIIDKGLFVQDANFIVDIFDTGLMNSFHLENGYLAKTKFYHFRIPLTASSGTYGSHTLASNPKFIRFFLTGFSSPVNLRFINLMFSEEVIMYTQ